MQVHKWEFLVDKLEEKETIIDRVDDNHRVLNNRLYGLLTGKRRDEMQWLSTLPQQ